MDSGPAPADNQPPAQAASAGSIWVRLAARVVDSLIVAVVGVALGFVMEFSPLWLVIQALLVYGYFVLLDAGTGSTPGKRTFGLALLGPSGQRPTLAQSAAREAFTLVGAVPFAGPVLVLVAWITIAATINSSPTSQGVHDRLGGGTRVVGA